jgi:hypothetical protein
MAYWLRCESLEVGQYGTVEIHGLRGVWTSVDELPYMLTITLATLDLPAHSSAYTLKLTGTDPHGEEFVYGDSVIPASQHSETLILFYWPLQIHVDAFGIYKFNIMCKSCHITDEVVVDIRHGSAPRTGLPIDIVEQVAFDAGDTVQCQKWISDRVGRAIREIRIVDPYWDESAYSIVAPSVPPGVKLILYCRKQSQVSQKAANEIWLSNDFHDRYLILDNSEYWHLGSSINHLGVRQTCSTRLRSPSVIEKIQARMGKATRIH